MLLYDAVGHLKSGSIVTRKTGRAWLGTAWAASHGRLGPGCPATSIPTIYQRAIIVFRPFRLSAQGWFCMPAGWWDRQRNGDNCETKGCEERLVF